MTFRLMIISGPSSAAEQNSMTNSIIEKYTGKWELMTRLVGVIQLIFQLGFSHLVRPSRLLYKFVLMDVI